MKNITELKQEYIEAIEKWGKENYLRAWKNVNKAEWTQEASIEQTLWCCDNSQCHRNGILIMGINPSFDKNPSLGDVSFANTSNNSVSQYWTTKKNMVKGIDKSEVSYLDLFPIRMTRQKDFMNDKVIPLSLKVALIEVTIKAIEMLSPKLIINANMGSSVYWGINKKKPWMGYDMVEVDNPIGKETHLYKIVGIIDDKRVISPNRKGLQDTLFLLAKYHGNGALNKMDFLTVEDILKIYK